VFGKQKKMEDFWVKRRLYIPSPVHNKNNIKKYYDKELLAF
jgi:hypothetical protein